MKTLYRITLTKEDTHWLYLNVPAGIELSEEQVKMLVLGSDELEPEWAGGFTVNQFVDVQKENRKMPWQDSGESVGNAR